MENLFNDVPNRLIILNPKAIINRKIKKIEKPLGVRFFCKKLTSGLLIVAMKIASKKGIKIPCAARIPATTTTKAAEVKRICWTRLVRLFNDVSIELILGPFYKEK